MSIRSVFAPLSSKALPILVLSLLLPVALAIIVFPTPMYDTRELIAWGRHFPIATPVHPPIMAWIGGAVDRLFGTSAAVMILAGQILLAIGLAYFYATLRLMTPRNNAALFTFLYGTSFYTVFAPLSFALNADLLQLTSWPAVVFHFLRAGRSGRLGQWIAFGAWSAVAVLTKYNAGVLFIGMAAATVALPTFRRLLKSPGPYVAAAVGAVLIAPHAIAVARQHAAITYGLEHFDAGSSIGEKFRKLYEFGLGFLICFAPGFAIVIIGLWKGVLTTRGPREEATSDERQFLLVMNAAMQIVLLGLVMIAGLDYVFRFSAPYVMMAVLALAPWIGWKDGCRAWVDRLIVPAVGWIYLAAAAFLAVFYTAFASHSGMQEPTVEAARMILADWASTYSCGPAYFLGGRQGVYGVGIEAGRKVTTLDYRAVAGASWFDADKLRTNGAVVIDTDPEFRERMARFLPGIVASDEKRITLPLRRSYRTKTFTTPYHFVAPQGCGQ
jgi:4-amino-4-deoxy-L-arabinose transferase-like glycosyltransferase